MSVLILSERKKNDLNSSDYTEIDLTDLELYGSVSHSTKEFSEIVCTKLGSKSLIEWFSNDNISFWWFVHPIIYPKFNDAVLFIDRFISCLEHNKPAKVLLRGNFDKFEIVKEICKLKEIDFSFSYEDYLLFVSKQQIKKLLKSFFYNQITGKKQKKRMKLFNNKKSIPTGNDYTLITSHEKYRRSLFDPDFDTSVEQEFIMQPIMNVIKTKETPLWCIDFDYTFRGEFNVFEKRLQSDFNWIPVEFFLEGEKSVATQNTVNMLKKSIQKMKKEHIVGLFVYRDISLWKYLERVFDEIFLEPYLPTYIHLMEKLESYFKSNMPKVIMQIYETGPYAKAFEFIAKKLGIKNIGVQHGLIYEGNPDYMPIKISSQDNPLGKPIPDLTFVFGAHYKKILVEKAYYPETKIAVIGNPAFYEIDKIKKMLNKNNLLIKNKLPDKKIILILLSYRLFTGPKNSPDFALLDILHKGFQNNDDIILLVRPHPGDAMDFSNKMTNLYPNNKFKYSKNSLFEDIFVSDVVVTTISAAGADSVMFEKPVIYANIGGNTETTFNEMQKDMIKHDVAISCNVNDLITQILSIKKGELWKMESSEKRKQFVHSYFNYGESIDFMKLIYGN